MRVAFLGFRHGHIKAVYKLLQNRPGVHIVGACEEDAATRAALAAEGLVTITHAEVGRLLDDLQPDAVAIGDYYGRRGALAIEALTRGMHVLSDKPLCTSLAELETIARLATAGRLTVMCQLDQRGGSGMLAARAAIRGGEIGTVHAIAFGGQHPLLYGTRPAWYFEPGKHGGTINDIAIHAVNSIPWVTGLRVAMVNGARAWNARLREVPHFQDAAQMMLTLDNGCGVLGDVSYLMPDSFGYQHPFYWRFEFWGSGGVIEVSKQGVTLWKNGAQQARVLPPASAAGGSYFDAFLNEIQKTPAPEALSTADVLEATRVTLHIQRAADQHLSNVAL